MADLTTEYNRILQAKENIKQAINSKGGNLTTERIDQYANAVLNLPSGGFNGEEITGVAGENLVQGDIVGYFEEPNLIQNLTNYDISGRYFFDNGNKYYKLTDTIKIYRTDNDQLIETRPKPAQCYVCNNFEQPDIDYLSYYDVNGTKNLIIYQWDPITSQYVVVRSFTELELKVDSAGTSYRVLEESWYYPCIMKDYLFYIIYYKNSNSYYQLYAKVIKKSDYSIRSMIIYGSSKNSPYGQESLCDYYRNRIIFCVGNHQGSLGMSTQYLMYYDAVQNELVYSASLYVAAGSKVYFYMNSGKGYVAINESATSYSGGGYRGVLMVNNNGQLYNIDQYNTPYYFVSASSDFNQIVLYNLTNQTYHLANVALKTITQITDASLIPNYYQIRGSNSQMMPIKEDAGIKIYMRNTVEFANKIAKVTGFTSSFRKVIHPGYGYYSYLGVAKEDALKGQTVPVNKIIDY